MWIPSELCKLNYHIMKKYYSVIYFILTAVFFCISLILNLSSKIQGIGFVLLFSSIGILFGDYLRRRKNISISARNKKLIISILLINIIGCLIFIFVIESLLLKQILIGSLLLISSVISILIVLSVNKT